MAAILGGYRWRLGYLRCIHRLEQQAALASERARIAKDLHDGLVAKEALTNVLRHAQASEVRVRAAVRESVFTLANNIYEKLHVGSRAAVTAKYLGCSPET